jgi:ribosomal protein S20
MKVAKTGTISKKMASRKISRITKKINNSKK